MSDCLHPNKTFAERCKDSQFPLPAKLGICPDCQEEFSESIPLNEWTEYEKAFYIKFIGPLPE